MNLADVRDVDQREKTVDLDLRTSFFECFALCAINRGFAVLHEAGGKRPATLAWFDGTATEQDLALPLGDAANDKLRIQVVDGLAARADMTRQRVAGRDAELDRGAALVAVVHGGWRSVVGYYTIYGRGEIVSGWLRCDAVPMLYSENFLRWVIFPASHHLATMWCSPKGWLSRIVGAGCQGEGECF